MKIYSLQILFIFFSLWGHSNATTVSSCGSLLLSLQESVAEDVFVEGNLLCVGSINWPSSITIQSSFAIAGDTSGASMLSLPPDTKLIVDQNNTLKIKNLILFVSSVEEAFGLQFLEVSRGSQVRIQNVIFAVKQCTGSSSATSGRVMELHNSIVSNSDGETLVKICKSFCLCDEDGRLSNFVLDAFTQEDCCSDCFKEVSNGEQSSSESFIGKLSKKEVTIAAVILLALVLIIFVFILALLLRKSKSHLDHQCTETALDDRNVLLELASDRNTMAFSDKEKIESHDSKLQSSEIQDLQSRTLTDRNFRLSDVEIKQPLGKGSFGKVYKGHWQGTDVAVKCIVHGRNFLEARNEPFEAYLSRHVSHPNVVQTFIIHTVPRGDNDRAVSVDESIDSSFSEMAPSEAYNRNIMMSTDEVFGSLAKGPGAHDQDSLETWIVLEFCDRGPLSNAVKGGFFQSTKQRGKRPNIVPAVLTALDIASAMMYLHNIRIVHGDLKAENVLLKSDVADPRGFVCKVSDFGLSRFLAEDTHLETFTYGTITHMPPELLKGGILTPAADVYSFAVLMWELLTGVKPFEGKTHGEIVLLVVNREKRPPIPDYCPDGYAELLEDCWRQSYLERPGFPEVVDRLKELLVEEEERELSEINKGSGEGSMNQQDTSMNPGSSAQNSPLSQTNEHREIVPEDNEDVSRKTDFYRNSC